MDKERKSRGIAKFQKRWYDDFTWLCGCEVSNKLYCWPCILFSHDDNKWNTKGFTDITNFSLFRKRHQVHKDHILALATLLKFGKKERIETSLDGNIEEHNEKVKNNRFVLSRLIDIITFLGRQEAGVQNEDSKNRGNYIDLLHFMAESNDVLAHHLRTATVFIGSSPDIETDMMAAIACVVKNEVKKELDKAQFAAIIIDETTDASHTSQLSTTVRYVYDGEVQERFVKFEDVSQGRSAQDLSELLSQIITELSQANKLVCVTYDGATVDSGCHSDLLRRFRQKYPMALFVHCYAHELNHVLQQSMKPIKQCRVFFDSCNGFSAFFSRSSARMAALESCLDGKPTMRWIDTYSVITVLHTHKTDLQNLFNTMAYGENEKWDGETRMSAVGYAEMVGDFEFIFLLCAFHKIFDKSKTLFDYLQANMSEHLEFCNKKISDFEIDLKTLRDNFSVTWEEAKAVFDENTATVEKQRTDIVDKETSYRILFNEILDTVMTAISDRFSDLGDPAFFKLMWFKKFTRFNISFPADALKSLNETYPGIFQMDLLKSELSVIYSEKEYKKKSVFELYKYILSFGLRCAFPETCKLCELILTIPSTSAGVETSFSALKRINSYQRSSQGQERKNHLGLISIEKSFINKLRRRGEFHDSVIDVFDRQKNRGIKLQFK